MTYVIKLSIIDIIFQKIIDIFHIYFLYNMTKIYLNATIVG